MRFDLGVIGSAGLARAQSLTLELPIAGSVSGMNLQAEYSFVPSALSWDEKSSVVRSQLGRLPLFSSEYLKSNLRHHLFSYIFFILGCPLLCS